MEQTHVALPGSRRPTARNAQRLRDASPQERLEVTVTLAGPPLPDPGSLPAKGLTPEEYAARYGASEEDAAKARAALEGYGLSVADVSLPTRSMRLSGTIEQVERAFGTKLGVYRTRQGEYRGREGQLAVPAELAGVVTGVFGLDERQVAHRRTAAPARVAGPLTPSDLEQRYAFPPGDGAGQQVAIAEFGGGYFAEDVTALCQKYGIPDAAPHITPVSVGLQWFTLQQIEQMPRTQAQEELAESGEVMMDVEIVATLCPAADIAVYFAPFSEKGWVDLLDRAILQRPVALSISWGAPEDAPRVWSTAAQRAINHRLAALATLGTTVCVSSGDDGSGDDIDDGKAHVDFPASSPYVLAVGGTEISGGTEQIWWDQPGTRFTPDGSPTGGGATGGGVSVRTPRPPWQTVSVPSENTHVPEFDGRVVPDVAALAGEPFYDLILAGHDAPNGGTSASAPLWASLITRVQAGLPPDAGRGFLTPFLYQDDGSGTPYGKTVCRDITQGSNGSDSNASLPEPGFGYSVGPGFDATTGWGVPNGTALLEALTQVRAGGVPRPRNQAE